MLSKKITQHRVYVWILAIASLPACATSPQSPPQQSKVTSATPAVETRAAPNEGSAFTPTPLQTPAVREPAKSTPAQPNEIKNAVARVFADALSVEPSTRPTFVTGDFNGDGFEDLAVALKPRQDSLNVINSEVANWTVEDPANVAAPNTSQAPRSSASTPVHVERDSSLLAIIHGIGALGWRNPEAKQSYLLKNGAGSDMVVQSAKQLRTAKDKRRLPPLQGDAIQETIASKPGLIFWTGSKYAWYSNPSSAEADLR